MQNDEPHTIYQTITRIIKGIPIIKSLKKLMCFSKIQYFATKLLSCVNKSKTTEKCSVGYKAGQYDCNGSYS